MKKSLISILIAALVSGLLPSAAFGAEARTVSANDPYYSLQWGLYSKSASVRDVNYEEVCAFLEEEKTSLTETVVAVLDTGIDSEHTDLAGSMWTNEGEIPGNGRDDDRNGFVDDVHGYDFSDGKPLREADVTMDFNHGTHCAGTIAAERGNRIGIAGLAGGIGKVSVMDVKVLRGKDATGSTNALIRGIRYAEANGADICNLSMGSYRNDRALYRTIAESDMLFVCAAGNDRTDLAEKPIYPGCYDLDNVICVGNAAKDGTLYKRSNYSSSQVDIAAPGTDIYSTITGNRCGSMTGTSMAAPFVSAAAALLHSYYPDITAAEMRRLILDSAVRLESLSGKVSKGRYLDAYAPLTYHRQTLQKDTKAPVLKASALKIKGSYKQKLSVKALDDSGRKPKVRYVRGDKNLSYFRGGKGFSVKLDELSRGSKTMAVPSVYSIYAADAAGNDRVVKVRCTADAVSSVRLNYSKKTVYKGKSYTLKAALSKKGKNGRKLTFTSSDPRVASVSSKGKVTGKKKGTAVITVKTGNGLTDTCKIVVK